MNAKSHRAEDAKDAFSKDNYHALLNELEKKTIRARYEQERAAINNSKLNTPENREHLLRMHALYHHSIVTSSKNRSESTRYCLSDRQLEELRDNYCKSISPNNPKLVEKAVGKYLQNAPSKAKKDYINRPMRTYTEDGPASPHMAEFVSYAREAAAEKDRRRDEKLAFWEQNKEILIAPLPAGKNREAAVAAKGMSALKMELMARKRLFPDQFKEDYPGLNQCH